MYSLVFVVNIAVDFRSNFFLKLCEVWICGSPIKMFRETLTSMLSQLQQMFVSVCFDWLIIVMFFVFKLVFNFFICFENYFSSFVFLLLLLYFSIFPTILLFFCYCYFFSGFLLTDSLRTYVWSYLTEQKQDFNDILNCKFYVSSMFPFFINSFFPRKYSYQFSAFQLYLFSNFFFDIFCLFPFQDIFSFAVVI